MAEQGLERIPVVDIDPDGVFKYVLIRVSVREGSDESKDIVRGYGWAEYHADIYDKAAAEIEKDRVYDCECLGGGRINHSSSNKKIHIYGHSLGFGRARHAVTMELVKAKYPDYEVTWSDDGY
ncbi:14 kDa phosphohistidine phosphatase [Bufo gargarizans]|uniref:14 kDa phosphohistidine phosphatase n=1 Tax=Bufo gargarizans TaxID=30331 RepID=UPI001CF5EE1A|nr:14 kDa phosphohistidine phosphatase [Bufo gargarizans]